MCIRLLKTGEEAAMPEKRALVFTPVDFADYDKIFPYTSAYGEGSCQHSPVSMISQAVHSGWLSLYLAQPFV